MVLILLEIRSLEFNFFTPSDRFLLIREAYSEIGTKLLVIKCEEAVIHR